MVTHGQQQQHQHARKSTKKKDDLETATHLEMAKYELIMHVKTRTTCE
jgi:hypothetical protein